MSSHFRTIPFVPNWRLLSGCLFGKFTNEHPARAAPSAFCTDPRIEPLGRATFNFSSEARLYFYHRYMLPGKNQTAVINASYETVRIDMAPLIGGF